MLLTGHYIINVPFDNRITIFSQFFLFLPRNFINFIVESSYNLGKIE